MEKEVFVDLVKKHFGFLEDRYGFTIVHAKKLEAFGDCSVVLQSGDCRLRIMMDRGVVEVEAGLKYAPYADYVDEWKRDSPRRWYNLYYITRFLTQGPNQAEWEFMFPEPGFDKKTRVERQMIRLVNILEPYWDQIIEVFQEDTFNKRQKDLGEFLAKLAEEHWEIKRKNKTTPSP